MAATTRLPACLSLLLLLLLLPLLMPTTCLPIILPIDLCHSAFMALSPRTGGRRPGL
jgi:hypothetical protein